MVRWGSRVWLIGFGRGPSTRILFKIEFPAVRYVEETLISSLWEKKMKETTIDQCKDTGLAMTLIFLLIIWFNKNLTYLGPAIIVLIVTMTWPKLFKHAARLLFALSNFMSEFVSKILLSIIYFLLVTPLGVIKKMDKDTMRLKEWKDNGLSAFKERNHRFTAADLEKPF